MCLRAAMTWDSSDGTLRQSFDGNAADGATVANTVMLASEATRFHVGYNFQISDQDWLDGTENSIQFGTGLISDADLVTKSSPEPTTTSISPQGGTLLGLWGLRSQERTQSVYYAALRSNSNRY